MKETFLEYRSYTTEQYLRELVGECQRSLLEEIKELKANAITQEKKYEKLKKSHNDLIEIFKTLTSQYERHTHGVISGNYVSHPIEYNHSLGEHSKIVLQTLTIKSE